VYFIMPSKHHRDADIEQRADDQRHDDAEGQIFLRIARFLGGGGDRIESDVGEENDCASGHDSGKAGRGEGRPVRGFHQHSTDHHEGQNGADLDRDHDVVGLGRFLHAAHQQQRQNEDNQEAWEIKVRAGPLPRSPHGTRPLVRQVHAERRELRFRVTGKADRHGDVADHVFENQVPADDPGEDLAERRVRIGVGAPAIGIIDASSA
jgi:hypothetical protein